MSKRTSVAKYAWLCLLPALVVLLLLPGRLQAQAQTATVSGTAADASGGALVNANIQATELATAAVRSTTTDTAGRYRIADLPVGTYDIQASLTGFQTVVHKGVVLSIGGYVIVDFSLPVGQVTTTVSVEAEVTRVETETSEVSTLVTPQQMRELPLNGRNFEQLLALAPGVVTVPAQMNLGNFVVGRMYGAMDNYSVAGARPTGQMFLLDGVDIRDFWEHATGSGYGGTSLGVEALGEFQVLSNTYNAQFAGNGVTLNATSRAGTNDWHGGAYEFIRNNDLDARSLTDQNAGLKSPPPFRRNQYGGAVGGPIMKDKLFFFANYEGLRQGLTTTNTFQALPMAYVRNGELPCSQMTGVGTCTSGPYSGLPGSATNPIEPVPPFNGSALAAANLTRMTQIMQIYNLCQTCSPKAVPTASNGSPNPADLGGYYYGTTQSILNVNEDYAMGRVDYTYSSKDSIFGRYTFDNAHVDDPRDPMQIFPEVDHTRNQFVTITEKHIVSNTMVNSLRFGFTRTKEASVSQFHLTSAQLAKLGLAYDPLWFTGPNGANYPGVQRTDASVGLAFFAIQLGPDLDRPDTLIQNKFSGGDDLVWTHGAHSLKIGGVVQRIQTNNNQLNYAVGGAPTFTSALALLQGQASTGYFVPPGFGTSTRYYREIGLAPYIQDDWKISSKLTLNLGIRFDYFTNPVGWAPGGAPLTQVPGSFLPPIGPLAQAPTCPAYPAETLVQLAACQLSIFTPVKHLFASDPNAANWAPRFGFAYDVFKDHKTSLRGGFAVLHDPVAARIYESGTVFTPPAASYNENKPGINAGPCIPDAFAVSAGYCGYTNIAPGEFAAVTYQDPWGSPYLMQYNFGVQHEILTGTVLSVSYVGSLGRHEWMQRDENPPMCSTFPNCSAIPAPTAAGANTGACFVQSRITSFAPFTVAPGCGPGLAVFAAYPTISSAFGSRVMEAPTSASSYSSLQVTLNRQFSKNIAGQVNYSWSHCIDNGSFATSLEEWGQLQTDPYNQKYDYGNCNYDIRHNLVGNVLYSLPFKGNRLVEGWQLTSIVSVNSGTPLNITNFTLPSPAADPSGLAPQWWTRENYTFAAGCSPNQMIKKWALVGTQREFIVFNNACYAPQQIGYVGNVGRNSIPGVGFINVDFSVMKNTKITERLNAQFRAEFFNVANHFNPSGPLTNQAAFPGFFGPAFTQGITTTLAGNPRQIQFALKLNF